MTWLLLFQPIAVSLSSINVFKVNGMVWNNHKSLMILDNNANFIHFVPIFSASSGSWQSFTLQVWAIHIYNNFSYVATNVGQILYIQQNNWYNTIPKGIYSTKYVWKLLEVVCSHVYTVII